MNTPETIEMKYYYTRYGCMGHIGNDKYRLFATPSEYYEYMKDNSDEYLDYIEENDEEN